MGLSTATYEIQSSAPLVMHNGELANPLHPIAQAIKEVTGKKKKTEEDYARVQELEFHGGMYLAEDGKTVIIPDHILESMLRHAAKRFRLGKVIPAVTTVLESAILDYSGSKDMKTRYTEGEFRVSLEKVGTAKVVRTTPIFHNWSTTFIVHYDKAELESRQLDEIVKAAGVYYGIGERRPKYGRFEVVNITHKVS